MAKWQVEVTYTSKKTLTIYARDEDEAAEKAEEIVSGWANVEDCEATDVEEA